MPLPKEKKKAETGFPERDSWLVFGAPKIGKTTFAASWPECLIIDLEDGTRYVSGAYVARVQSLAELRELYAELRAIPASSFPYKTVAIDTIDVLNDWIEAEVCRELGIVQMGEKQFGLDWALARNRVLDTMKAFSQLPCNVLWLAHSRWAVVNEVEVGHTINLPGKLARFVMASVDNVLFLTIRNGQRIILFRPHQGIECGSRHPILDQAGECPMSYAALRGLFEASVGPNKEKHDKTGQNKELI